MGTNYYVVTDVCVNACEHCSASERLHLGKTSAGWRFLFRADPAWPRDEAFSHWVRRALSGTIIDESGRACTLADLLNMAVGRQDAAPSVSDFKSSGHDFCIREFS